ncbi:MAG: calcium/sodium antiporter [Crocinitomicaceae bacterium]|tara:strand:- start:4271 stop:5230 length:960 start_codon:yes stop_codon:yes gene_type:complete
MDYVFLLLGLVVLIFGGEFLVKGAVGFSTAMKISPLIVGMTIVSFGTSAPELLVSLTSALDGNPGIAVGNVVGSNIANIALVLGITVLIFPIIADKHTKRIDMPVMIFSTLLFVYFIQDGWIVMYEGIIMLVVIVAFTIFLIIKGRKQPAIEEVCEIVDKAPKNWKSILFLFLGFIGLYFGADWFIQGAVGIAEEFLFDNPNKDVIIGVTIVAFGTSAPELVASTVAAYRKQTDISIGNLIGSNIFNILVVLGVTSIVTPLKVSNEAREFDLFWMVGIALLLVALIALGSKIGRLKGAILLSTYVAYITIILLRVQGVL